MRRRDEEAAELKSQQDELMRQQWQLQQAVWLGLLLECSWLGGERNDHELHVSYLLFESNNNNY